MQIHRFISQILQDIAALNDAQQRVEALRRAPKHVRALLRFAFGDFPLAIGRERIDFTPIPAKAYDRIESTEMGDDDLLAASALKLERLFAEGGYPALKSERRTQIWRDIVERLPEDEVEILEEIRLHRRLPRRFKGLTREIVEAAWPGILSQPVVAQGIEPYQAGSGHWAPAHISEAPVPVQQLPRELSEAEARYQSEYAKIRFG